MSKRLHWLDVLRGVAALLVCVTHMLDALSPAFVTFRHTTLQIGQIGVVAFFVCSGFIVPASLERQLTLGSFWIGRFFRLFTLYWASIGAAVVLSLSGCFSMPSGYAQHPIETLLANLTMAPSIFGVEHVSAVYWTLTQELLFYVVLSITFAARVHRLPVPLALGFLGTSILLVIVRPDLVGTPTTGNFFLYLGLMWSGTVLYQYEHGTVHRAVGGLVLVVALSAVAATLLGLFAVDVMLPVVAAQILGILVFLGLYGCRRFTMSPILMRLGHISFGLYLLHPLIIALIPPLRFPALTFSVWLGGTIVAAALAERWIERPSIALGRRLTRRSQVEPSPQLHVPKAM